MRFPHDHRLAPTEFAEAEQRVRTTAPRVLGLLAQRADQHLPGLQQLYRQRVQLEVFSAPDGALGTYQAHHRPGHPQKRSDLIRLNIGHLKLARSNSTEWAEQQLTTLLHELVHLYAERNNIPHSVPPAGDEHTRQFADLAKRAGLRVLHQPLTRTKFYTPGLSAAGRTLYRGIADQFVRIFHPERLFAGVYPDPLSTVALATASPITLRKEPVMSDISLFRGQNQTTQQGRRLTGTLARQTRHEVDTIGAHTEIAAVTEQANAFLASVAMTNVSVLVNQAETLVRNNPNVGPYIEPLLAGYAVGAAQRLHRGV